MGICAIDFSKFTMDAKQSNVDADYEKRRESRKKKGQRVSSRYTIGAPKKPRRAFKKIHRK